MGIADKLRGIQPKLVPDSLAKRDEDTEFNKALLDVIKGGEDKEKAGQRQAADTKARDLVNSVGRVAFDQYGVARLIAPLGGRLVALRLESQSTRDFLQATVADVIGKPLGKETLTAELERMRGKARIAGSRVKVAVRVSSEVVDGATRHYLNLANPDGEMVEIAANGWRVVHNDHVAFIDGVGQLPRPAKPSNLVAGYELVCDFLARAGVPEHIHLIVVAVLIEWLRDSTAYPILDIIGPAGGGKTSLALALVSLIDPPLSGKLAEAKAEDEHIGALAQVAHVLTFDNASKLSSESQNLFCRVCYGCESTPRKFYSQTEVERLPIHCPVLITSINPAITQSDLMNRAVRVQFATRKEYASQLVVGEKLKQESAQVLGALLELFAAGLALLDIHQKWPHRLVDFVQMGEAIAAALGMERGTFAGALKEANKQTAQDYAEGDPFIKAVVATMNDLAKDAPDDGGLPPWKSWAGGAAAARKNDSVLVAITPQGLHDRLVAKTKEPGNFGYRSPDWVPANARALTSTINLKLPVLRDLGIVAEHKGLGSASTKRSVWVFTWETAN